MQFYKATSNGVVSEADIAEQINRVYKQADYVGSLVVEGRTELRNFGVFEVKRQAARRARNPQTGESVNVPERFVVKFKPGQVMQQRVAELGSQGE